MENQKQVQRARALKKHSNSNHFDGSSQTVPISSQPRSTRSSGKKASGGQTESAETPKQYQQCSATASEYSPSVSQREHSPFSAPATPATSYSTVTNVSSVSRSTRSTSARKQDGPVERATLDSTPVIQRDWTSSPSRKGKSKAVYQGWVTI